MSRVRRAPIPVPPKVQVTWTDANFLTVKGPKGELSYQVDTDLALKLEDGVLTVSRPSDSREHRAKHGLYRSLVNNMVVGVTNGYAKSLEIHGVGYRAAKVGERVELDWVETGHGPAIKSFRVLKKSSETKEDKK